MVIQQFPHLGIAFAAIPAHAEAFDQLLAGAGSLIDGFADLSVGHCFADTDIHISNLYPNPRLSKLPPLFKLNVSRFLAFV